MAQHGLATLADPGRSLYAWNACVENTEILSGPVMLAVLVKAKKLFAHK